MVIDPEIEFNFNRESRDMTVEQVIPELHLLRNADGSYGGTTNEELYGAGTPLNGANNHIEENYYKLDFTLDEIRPDYKFDVEDSASGVFRFENGAQLIFETSWSFNGPGDNSTQIAGDKAGITLEPFKLYKADGEKLIEEDIEGDFSGDIFENEIVHFMECIRNDKTPSSNIEQAVQLQKMLMGIYESSKRGCEIKLD